MCDLNPEPRVDRRFSGELASLRLEATFAVAWTCDLYTVLRKYRSKHHRVKQKCL